MAGETPVAPQPMEVREGVDASKIPAKVQAEFRKMGNNTLDPKANAELKALEKQIEAELKGQAIPGQAAPLQVAPLPPIPPQPAPLQAPQAQLPAAPAPAAQAPQAPSSPEIPDKFKTPEGDLDTQKLDQSMANLQKYLDWEKEKSRVAQERINLERMAQFGYPQPGQVPPGVQYPQFPAQPQYPAQMPFEQRVAQDMRDNPVQTIVNLHRAAVQAAEAKAMAGVEDLRRRQELMEIAQFDPAVFTPAGLSKLTQIRESNPWIDAGVKTGAIQAPWTIAYRLSGGIGSQPGAPMAGRVGGQGYPTRPAQAAPTLGGGQQAPVPQTPVAFSSEADLRRNLDATFGKDNYAAQAAALEQALVALQRR